MTMSAPILAARPRLRVDIVDAPVGRHLPALDGVVEVVRIQSPDPDQLRERRLDIAGVVDAPRLDDGLAPVPRPLHAEARAGARGARRPAAAVPPGLAAV